jgi:2-polyprenyl-3-methyl-5-hydroxy-6-metoxy-1,4-benzoquinol methylase
LLSHLGNIVWKSGKNSIIDCKNCGFYHANPIPKLENLEKMYTHKFYQKMKPAYIKKDELENDYWNITFDDKLKTIEKIITKKNKKILDIGCGPGFFLQQAKKRKWNVLGIEPSTMAANYARNKGIQIAESTFESFCLTNKEKFDAIHSKFFLEHVRDPKQVCNDCYDLLNTNGVICFEVPNDFNILQKIVTDKLNKKQYWIAPPQHINYFSMTSLQNLLKKSGFKPFYAESTFPLEFFLLFGFDYIDNDKIGKKIHNMRMNLEKFLQSTGNNQVKRDLYNYFAEKGIGREIIVYAKKIKA